MKKNHSRIYILILTLIMICSLCVPSFATEKTSVEEPQVTAKGAIVYCENTGETIYSKGVNTQLSPYSITKVLTALLAVQKLPMDQEVKVSAKAASQGGSSMELKAGEVVTVEELLYGTLLPSGNDAAYALGETISGNMEDFVKLMNSTAKNIGCKNTHFSNPNGLYSKRHYSTAYDMLQITRAAFSNETVKAIAGTSKYKMRATNKNKARTLENHATFVGKKNSGVFAAKTGYGDDYDCSMVLGYKKNGLNLFVVVIGDTMAERTKDLKALINYATEKVEGIKVIGANKAVGKVRIKHGAKTRLETYTQETGYAYIPKEGSESLISTEVVMDDVTAPVKSGDVVGKYQIYVADELVNEVPIIIKEDVEEGWFPSYLGISNFLTVIIGIILTLIIIALISIRIIKARNRRIRKRRKQQKIEAIARRQAEIEAERNKRNWTF